MLATLAMSVALLVSASCSNERDPASEPPVARPDDYLQITTHDDGTERNATLSCCDEDGISGTGYLASLESASAAYITLSFDEQARLWLVDGELPAGEDCDSELSRDLKGNSLRVEGTFEGAKVDRNLIVQSGCEVGLWQHLQPVIGVAKSQQ